MGLKPDNPVVGGTTLTREAINSPGYVTGQTGWTINQDGSAEFTSLTVSGNSQFAGARYVIASSGIFFYGG